MSTQPQQGPANTTATMPAAAGTKPAAPMIVVQTIRPPSILSKEMLRQMMPPFIASGVFHIIAFLVLFLVLNNRGRSQEPPEQVVYETQIEEQQKTANLENEDIGLDPDVPLNYDKARIEEVSVPGPVDPTAAVGILNAQDGPPMNVSPPPGVGGSNGQGGGLDSELPGKGSLIGLPGGMGGPIQAGGFGGRSGATRERMLTEGGGNGRSEAAVARGLKWMSLHQSADGHWSLDGYNQAGKCNCGGMGQKHDVAGVAFGLLPFLGAGETHKKGAYSKNVDKGIAYLLSKQNSEGSFSNFMYEHGLATIAICEAYALTSDARLKPHAQKALKFIETSQSDGGGWRYKPKDPGFDTSVSGWQLMALKSGQMAGLSDGKVALDKAKIWLDAAMDPNSGGYGYTSAGNTPTLTSVGLLCRQYLGWGPRNPNLVKGVNTLLTPANLPGKGKTKNIYYYYYATQVMHHLGGDAWKKQWNEPMRDMLVDSQDQGNDKVKGHQRGSWDPAGDAHGGPGGRVMVTSLSLLSLEVYYRHLPLYRRNDVAADNK